MSPDGGGGHSPAEQAEVKEELEVTKKDAGDISADDADFAHAMVTNDGVEHPGCERCGLVKEIVLDGKCGDCLFRLQQEIEELYGTQEEAADVVTNDMVTTEGHHEEMVTTDPSKADECKGNPPAESPQVVDSINGSLVTFCDEPLVTNDEPLEDGSPVESWEFELNRKQPFQRLSCGCVVPRWKSIEWRDMENGHRYLYVTGRGTSANGKPVKKRKYGHYFTHRAVQLFVEAEYETELEQFFTKRPSKVTALSSRRVSRK